MKRILFKIVLPSLILVIWICFCYSMFLTTASSDLFILWIFVGFPYGIRKMNLCFIPSGYGIAGSIGVFVLNAIIGGLIGGIIVIFKIIGILLEILKIPFECIVEKNGRFIRIQGD